MIDFHCKNGGDITIATIPVNSKDATGFGILKSDEKGNITSFIEKPTQDLLVDWKSQVSEKSLHAGKEYLASMGIYVFSKEALLKMFSEDAGDDFGGELIPNGLGKYNMLSYQFDGYWTDIGTIESFYEANIDLTRELPQFNLFSSNPVYTRARMLPPSKINGSFVSKAIIADGCIIMADKIENSLIGNRARIQKGSSLKNCYMMGADYYESEETKEINRNNNIPNMGIGEHSHIEQAILDKNCHVGNHVKIIGGKHLPDGDFENHSVKDGIVVIKKGAIIHDGTQIF
jgi:glucose-1-phosphate adenylyltransferase